MAYPTNFTPANYSPINYSPVPASQRTGQSAYQVSKPKPIYQAPAATPKANPTPLVQAVTAPTAAVSSNPPAKQYHDFSQDAMTPQAQNLGMTPQQYSASLDKMVADRGVPAGGYYSPTANALTDSAAMGGNTTPSYTPPPTVSPTAAPVSSINPYKPELIQMNDGRGGVGISRDVTWSNDEQRILDTAQSELAGLEAKLANPLESNSIKAMLQYRTDYLREQVNTLGQRKQSRAGNQDTSALTDEEYAQQIATDPNASKNALDVSRNFFGQTNQNYKDQVQKAATSAADAAMAVNAQNFKTDRDRLINQLALRGLSVSSDSWAQAQMKELEDKYRALDQAAVAKQQTALVEADDKTRAYLTDIADKRLAQINKEKDQLIAEQTAKANAYSKMTTANTGVTRAEIEAAKAENTRLYQEGKITNEEYKLNLTAIDNESKADLRTSQAGLADANADFVAGAKTSNTEADTKLKDANTNKINTLLPAQLAELNAKIAKLQRVSSTGAKSGAASATPAELAAVVQLNKGNMPTSDKALAVLLNAVRVQNGDVSNLVDVGNAAAKGRAEATRAPNTFTPLF